MELTILCKVIDNFGDIGVAWRIAITPSVETPDPKNETIQDIDYYKEKAEKLESELHKSKIQINKLEATITKLQSTLSSYTTSNNTSDSFLLTSEFKKFWISFLSRLTQPPS